MKQVNSDKLICCYLSQKFGSGGSNDPEKYGFKEKIDLLSTLKLQRVNMVSKTSLSFFPLRKHQLESVQ